MHSVGPEHEHSSSHLQACGIWCLACSISETPAWDSMKALIPLNRVNIIHVKEPVSIQSPEFVGATLIEPESCLPWFCSSGGKPLRWSRQPTEQAKGI